MTPIAVTRWLTSISPRDREWLRISRPQRCLFRRWHPLDKDYPEGTLSRTARGSYGDSACPSKDETNRPWAIPLSSGGGRAYDVFYDPPRQSFVNYAKMWIDGPDGGMHWKHADGPDREQRLHPLVKTANLFSRLTTPTRPGWSFIPRRSFIMMNVILPRCRFLGSGHARWSGGCGTGHQPRWLPLGTATFRKPFFSSPAPRDMTLTAVLFFSRHNPLCSRTRFDFITALTRQAARLKRVAIIMILPAASASPPCRATVFAGLQPLALEAISPP